MPLNVDGSQFCVGSDENGRVVVKYSERVKDKPLNALPEVGDGGLRFSIKYYALIAAFGFAYDPVFVLADKTMNPEALDVYEVKGLGIANTITDKGCAVFCQSRVGNRAFFRWFVTSLLIPYVQAIRTYFDYAEDIMAWFQLDGEPIQIE